MSDPSPLPPWLWPRAAYVHVPFCAHHCGYCDFAVVTGHDDRRDDYLAALAAEVARLEVPRRVARPDLRRPRPDARRVPRRPEPGAVAAAGSRLDVWPYL